MSPSRHVRFSVLFVVMLTVPAVSAWACSCGTIGSNPPGQAVWDASAVFTGVVTEIIEPPDVTAVRDASAGATSGRRTANDPPLSAVPQKRVVRIKIKEALTSVVGLQETELVAYIHAVATAPATGEIRIVRGLPGAAPDAKVTIDGNGHQYVLTTDAAGHAALEGVPPGEYKIRAEREHYLRAERTVHLHAKGCVEFPLFMVLDRRIEGRVLTKEGLPAANVTVEARPTGDFAGDSVKTDPDGRYELHHFTAGGYYLGTNLGQPPRLDNPYTRWFYPGTENISHAAIIYFSDEAETKHYDFMLPEAQQERIIEGTVAWPDRRPEAGSLLFAYDPRWLWMGAVARTTADANGRFVRYPLNPLMSAPARMRSI